MTSIRRTRLASLAATALVVALALTPLAARAQGGGQKKEKKRDARWTAIARTFGQEGEEEDGYFRVNLPRTDLKVRIGDDALSPHFEFTSYLGFVPVGGGRTVLAMGEVILRDDELPAALDEARKQGVQVTAIHNHLIGETPRIVYVHVMKRGAADGVATALRAVFARTATPLGGSETEQKPTADWTAIDAVLGAHAEAEGPVAEYEFRRREKLRVDGTSVKSSGVIETGSEVVFQQLSGGRVATTGEIYLLASEVEPVVRTLEEHGLHVTALHTHMLDDAPARFWVHWYATGDGPTLARGLAAAIAKTNSARKSAHERD